VVPGLREGEAEVSDGLVEIEGTAARRGDGSVSEAEPAEFDAGCEPARKLGGESYTSAEAAARGVPITAHRASTQEGESTDTAGGDAATRVPGRRLAEIETMPFRKGRTDDASGERAHSGADPEAVRRVLVDGEVLAIALAVRAHRRPQQAAETPTMRPPMRATGLDRRGRGSRPSGSTAAGMRVAGSSSTTLPSMVAT
jgi:hypothetical protein